MAGTGDNDEHKKRKTDDAKAKERVGMETDEYTDVRTGEEETESPSSVPSSAGASSNNSDGFAMMANMLAESAAAAAAANLSTGKWQLASDHQALDITRNLGNITDNIVSVAEGLKTLNGKVDTMDQRLTALEKGGPKGDGKGKSKPITHAMSPRGGG